MSDTHLAVVGNRTRNAECLQALADSLGCVGSDLATLLDCYGGTDYVGPLGVLETDWLSLLAHLVGVDALGLADSLRILDAVDSVLREHRIYFIDSAVVTFK